MAGRASTTCSKQADSLRAKPHEESSKDIFETILASNLPIEEKQPKRMANEVFNLLIAGSLTTSKTAVVAVYHVLDNPEVCECLRMELLEAIPDPHTIPSVKTLQKLPMLVCIMQNPNVHILTLSQSAVIKETMRIACIVTTRFPMIVKQKALRHGNSTIPAGVSCSYVNLGQDEKADSFPS